MNTIATLGYEKASIEDFIATLSISEVQVLVDIREVPISRKRWFSKRALATAVAGAGIGYIHVRELGDPKPGREAARRGDVEVFRRIFRSHLDGENAQAALAALAELASRAYVCLLCFERDHSCCHRAMVAEEMASRDKFSIQHLGVRHGLARELDGENWHGSVYTVG